MKHLKPATFLTISALIISLTAPSPAGARETASGEPTRSAPTLSSGVTDLAEYEQPEIYVLYTDGTGELLTFSDENALSDAVASLSADPAVSWFQPNYSYDRTGEMTDLYFPEQWALNNDGSFQIENEYDDFPFYTDPFDDPYTDWESDFWDSFPWAEDFFRDIGFTYGYGISGYSGMKTGFQPKAAEGIDIDMLKAWDAYDGGKRETIVAVIDTGIDYLHEDLTDAIWTNEDEIPGDGIDNDGNGYIDDYYGWNFYDNSNQIYNGSEDSHGTHGAGTIAASKNDLGIAGIAGDSTVRIMPVKALGGSEGTGTTDSIIQAIQYAEQNGAVICNLSFGTSKNDRALKNAIENSDMLFIAAAGNGSGLAGSGTGQNTDRSPIYPAAYDLDNIISVANIQYDGTLHYSSNYGKTSVDLAAPGSYILSTTPENTYSYMTGTSMAAPMVTGTAALIYSYYEDMTLEEVRERILASVKRLDSLDGLVATGGMLDAYAALTGDFNALEKVEEPEQQPDSGQETEDEDGTDSGQTSAGLPPAISASTYSDWYHRYLVLTVTDPDDDVAVIRYASGLWEAEDFGGGANGNSVTLDPDHTATFRITRRGTFTFYAADEKGNETVFSVYIR